MCKLCPGGGHSVLSRRQLLKLAGMFTAAGALPLLSRFNRAMAAEPGAPLRIGYLPLTDATPLLVAHQRGLFEAQGLEVDRPRLFRGWDQLVEAFLSGNVNVVHLLSPMALWARYGSGFPTRTVAWNHINGSALTVSLGRGVEDFADLGGNTLAIPFWYSIHNVVLQYLLRERGLEAIVDGKPGPDQVRLVVMAPADMLPGLATGRIAGYIVAEPFCGAAELHGVGKILRFTGDVWRGHACCVVQMHERDLEQRPEWTQKVVNAIVEAQAWILDHREDTVRLLSKDEPARYTPHTRDTLARTLLPDAELHQSYLQSGAIQHAEWGEQRIDFQPYPYPSYTERLVELLRDTRVRGDSRFLADLDPGEVARDLVDDRFVKSAIEAVGGPTVFGQQGYVREEVIRS